MYWQPAALQYRREVIGPVKVIISILNSKEVEKARGGVEAQAETETHNSDSAAQDERRE